ncbi:MAG: hypothetical protein H7287_10825 [Thermoleophilia bacterium]|nr:hypothetical protein [Thermoleophilia bacterium]
MPLARNLIKFAASPQGRKLIGQARRIATDPKQRQRVSAVKAAIARRRAAGSSPE